MHTLKIPLETRERIALILSGVKSASLMNKLHHLIHNTKVDGQTLPETCRLAERVLFYCHLSHESMGFTDLEENINYSASTAYRLWPKYFTDENDAQSIIDEEGYKGIMDIVYGNRYGNVDEHDGSKYIGRGLINLTFKANYEKINKYIPSTDIVKNPEALTELRNAYIASVAFIHENPELLKTLQSLDIRKSTKEINGGLNGFEYRSELWTKVIPILVGELSYTDIPKFNDKSELVKIIQLYVAEQDHDIVIDGHWGNATQKALDEAEVTTGFTIESPGHFQDILNCMKEWYDVEGAV